MKPTTGAVIFCFPDQRRSFLGILAAVVISLIGSAGSSNVFARPRPPLPPFPERGELFVWRFDAPPWAFGPFRAPSIEHNLEVVESWSGHALKMDGVQPRLLQFPLEDISGRANFSVPTGTVRFWFRPYWSSASAGGKGPGAFGRLVELGAWSGDARYGWWSLYFDPAGDTIQFSGQGAGAGADYLQAEIAWQAGRWYQVALAYSPKACALYVDGELAAQGEGVTLWPGEKAVAAHGFSVGSDSGGGNLAQGEFDEFTTMARPLGVGDLWANYYQLTRPFADLGPITPEEDAERRAAAAKRNADREAALFDDGGFEMMMLMGGTSECITNVPVYITNITSVFDTNSGWTVTFDIQGGTNGLLYDVFTTTNLLGNNVTNSQWTWLEQGPTCNTYQYTNQPAAYAFYILGTPQDTDGDGLTDAYEQLVSKTDPLKWDTDGDGLSDGWELAHGMNPNFDESAQTSGRINYEYDGSGWLRVVSGLWGESITLDAEGNLQQLP